MTTLTWPATINLPRVSPRKKISVLYVLICAAAILALCGRLVFLAWPFDSDGAMFIYLGKSVCDGDRFCHDVIDNKFPTVGLMTSVLWRAFGTHWAGYVLTQTALALGAPVLLARSVARRVSVEGGLATLVAALVYINFAPCVFGGFQLETIQLFFATISACAAIEVLAGGDRRDAALAGLAAGCAILLKPTGAAPLGALILILMHRGAWRIILTTLLGAMLPIAVGLLYIVHTGILADMLPLIRQIGDYAAHTPMRWDDLLKPVTVLMLLGVGMSVRGWVFRRHRHGFWPGHSITAFAILWFALEFLGAIAQRRMYAYHFLPIAPPAALLFGMIPRKATPTHLAAALSPIAALSLFGVAALWRAAPANDGEPISRYVLDHTKPTDAVWMDNAPKLLLQTGRRLGGRIPLTFIFGNTDDSALPDAAVLISDFSIRRPGLIILPSDIERRILRDQSQTLHLLRSPLRSENYAAAWRKIATYVEENYRRQAVIEDQTVWVRK